MEYIQNKFTQLAESLLAPVWAWVMARSWMFRLCVLVLGGVIFLAWYKPGIVSENYRLGISTLKVAMADGGHIALDFGTKAKLSSATQRLEKTVKSDLTISWVWSRGRLHKQSWRSRKESSQPPGSYAQNAISLIRSNETGGCFCWAEVPRQGHR